MSWNELAIQVWQSVLKETTVQETKSKQGKATGRCTKLYSILTHHVRIYCMFQEIISGSKLV